MGAQHQQLLISIGSGGTTPAATDANGKWKHNTSSYWCLYEVGTQHQQLLISKGSGVTTLAATAFYNKWGHSIKQLDSTGKCPCSSRILIRLYARRRNPLVHTPHASKIKLKMTGGCRRFRMWPTSWKSWLNSDSLLKGEQVYSSVSRNTVVIQEITAHVESPDKFPIPDGRKCLQLRKLSRNVLHMSQKRCRQLFAFSQDPRKVYRGCKILIVHAKDR